MYIGLFINSFLIQNEFLRIRESFVLTSILKTDVKNCTEIYLRNNIREQPTCTKSWRGDGSLEAVFDGVLGGRPAAKPPPSSGDIRDTDLQLFFKL